ncbi:unnamed protein product [Ascophyllum nodosum]
MSTTKVAMYVTFMFALAAAQDRTSQEVLKDLPLPWVVATLHFGAGMLWIFPAWTIGLRQTPSLNDLQRSKISPLAFLHAAGHLCDLGVFSAGSMALTHVFQQAGEPLVVCLASWLAVEQAQDVVAWLALLPLIAGVVITFQEVLTGSVVSHAVAACAVLVGGTRTALSQQVMAEEAIALKGQLCSVVFVSGCLALVPFALVMEGAQLVGEWERAAALVGNSALVIKIIQGGTLFYMWSECLFGLVEEAGALTAALAVAVRPVAVYAFSAAFWGGGWTNLGAAGTALTAVGAALFSAATHKYMLKQPLSKQQ